MKPGAQRWQAFGLVLAAVAVGIVCVANGARRIGQPFPGFLVAENGIVVSIARPAWALERAAEILFARVIAIDGEPVRDGLDLERHLASLPPAFPAQYRFRKRADVFSVTMPVKQFSRADFLTIYATYFAVGLCFLIAGAFAATRRRPHGAAGSFLLLCVVTALTLFTGADVYGPYWFTPVYFAAHALTPAALLHFASAFPEEITGAGQRRIALTALYSAAALLAVGLHATSRDPSLFLPLLYTSHLVLANAILLYLARLVIAHWVTAELVARNALRYALAGALASPLAPAVLFVVYPWMRSPVSPTILVAPLAFFPILTAAALCRAGSAPPQAAPSSLRLRLSLLFLAGVQTAFLVVLAFFWLSASWKQLLDDLVLNQRQLALVEHVQSASLWALPAGLNGIEAIAQTPDETTLVNEARAAFDRGDPERTRVALRQLADRYRRAAHRLQARRERLSWFDTALILALVPLALVQALIFMNAIRKWLVRPLDRLAEATAIIATGNLGHRIDLEAAGEFTALAASVNKMARSLAEIQQRVEAERAARQQAALAARHAERRRLARELHDAVLQDLSAAKLRLETLARQAASPQLTAATDSIVQAIVALRGVVDLLRPPDLGRASLRDAIAEHARLLATRYGVGLELALAEAASVPDWATPDVYRIAQEAIANAIRHGNPTRIRVALGQEGLQTVLEVEDDGVGFDVHAVARGSGLRGMQERAAALGADLRVTSSPGRGTLVRLTVPLSLAPRDDSGG